MKTERRRKNRNRLTALVLCMAMLVTSMPASAFASAKSTDAENTAQETAASAAEAGMYGTAEFAEDAEEPAAEPLAEDPSLRSETVKHFINDDGSYTAVNYFVPVHYQKEGSSTWTEIDNTLTASEDGQTYVPADSPVQAEIAAELSDGELVHLQGKAHEISWTYEDVKPSKSEKKQLKEAAKKDKKAEKLEPDKPVTDGRVYGDIAESTDLEVIVDGTSLKENLILKDKHAQTGYVIRYDTDGLSAEQKDSHTVLLKDGDETAFTISAPYMTDAAGAVSEDVSLQILSQDGGIIRVALSVDKKWLKDKERVYPVTVDPYVNETTKNFNYDACAIYNAGASYPYGTLVVGNDYSDYGRAKSYVKFELPDLKAGDMVTGGTLHLAQCEGSYGFSGGDISSLQLNAYRVTSSWTADGIIASTGYSGLPGRDTTVVDIENVSYHSGVEWTEFDVSRVVKDWYEGRYENYGLCIMADDESDWAVARFLATDCTDYVNSRPVLTVTYLNNQGLESRWTCHEQSLGESGTGYVNDYTGNLVFTIPLVETTGNLMPVSLGLVYNGYQKGKSVDQVTKAGEGWRLNIQQCIIPIDEDGTSLEKKLYAAGYRYIYEDADGTAHYFTLKENSSSVYVDEEGLGLELKTVSTDDSLEHYRLTADDGGKLTFTSRGYLRKAYDDSGNFYTVKYSEDVPGAVTYILDGAGRKIDLTRDAGNRVTKVTDPAGRNVTLAYSDSGQTLLTVTYPDGTSTSLGYTEQRLRRIRGRDNIRLQYLYPDKGDASTRSRVVGIEEYSSSDGGSYAEDNRGNTLEISYAGNNRTRFTDNDDFHETYQFDNYGRTISVTDSNGNAGTYKYQGGTDGSKKANTVKAAGVTSAYVDNLLENHSFENGIEGWNRPDSGTLVTTQESYLGEKSVLISGADAYLNQKYAASSGTYTFSAYVKTSSADVLPRLQVYYYDENGDYLSAKSSRPLDREVSWERMRLTFKVPDGVSFFRVRCSIEGTGSAWFDCMQLETGRSVNAYNLVENGSFSDTDSAAWTKTNMSSSAGDGYTTSDTYGRCYRIYGDGSTYKRINQKIQIGKKAEKVHFLISGLGYGKSVPLGDDRRFSLCIYTYFTDDTDTYAYVNFNPDYAAGWQAASGTVGYGDGHNGKTVDYIEVRCVYNYNENWGEFDNIRVSLDETGTAYTYDDDGNLITATDNAGRHETFTYNSSGDLVKAENKTDDKEYTYTYSTSSKHRLLSAVSKSSGLKFKFAYDDDGNVTAQTVRHVTDDGTESEEYIKTRTYYTDSGNYVAKENDDRGRSTTYTTDETKGLVTQVTDKRGNTTSYSYDAADDSLLSVGSGDAEVNYTYNSKNYLTKISTPSTSYSFTYDAFGNPLKTKAGDTVLNTNTYASENGNLTKSTYGNGFTREYGYDEYDRVTSEKRDGETRYYWAYNADGQVGRHYDTDLDKEYHYTYDLIGRLIRTDVSDGSYYRAEYNRMNLGTSVHYGYADSAKHVYYTYSGRDNLPLSVKFGTGSNCVVKNSYDDLTRLTAKTYTPLDDGVSSIKTEFGYIDWTGEDNAGRTTGVVNRMDYSYTSGALELDDRFYSYDAGGNITGERSGTTESGDLREKYTYDALNRLTRHDSAVQNKSYTYTYDDAGNILSKSEYAYTTGTLGEASDTVTYTYSSGSWGDLLTSYDGKAVTYDAIGNMTSYDGDTYTWEGRELKQITGGGGTSSYRYNAEGIRTEKTVNGVTTEYFVSGDQIIAQKSGDLEMWFYYDSEGNRVGMSRNGLAYYYLYNVQGDVVGLVRASTGKVVATYEYDAWGSCTVTNAEGYIVGSDNPFRYRGYYYDAETGLYYLNSRYYSPEIGRFISADSEISGVGEDIRGYNLYSYCFNNPVNMSDPDGNWPKWINDALHSVNKVIGTAKKWLKNAGQKVSELCGITVQVDQEVSHTTYYAGIATYESGAGYNKSFDTGKPVNFYKTVPASSPNFWDGGKGVDFNSNGYGFSMQLGNEDSLSINLPEHSYEFGSNTLGRIYYKYSYVDASGVYSYQKFTINGPEAIAGVLICLYAPEALVVGSVGTASFAGGF